ncbi:hypothetical protein PVAP13_5NG546886 [Panicum virgatum]|uniref:U3 small nucleolar RNA-associated protein 11 n=1 Tax=Panicum virgatum TaxID=38727 RepID=A0A8T0S428_PANVG|nr:hypothetical protein PVAP13_5NG546886 [Panicum virgatum]
MSSLRNSIPRRAHKERAQPEARKKFGLLEKHKDYVVRSKAFHRKEEIIGKLREKAAFRNPDEFYFKMINSKTVGGVHRPKYVHCSQFYFKMINSKTVGGVHRPKPGANKYTEEELLLLKNKDMGYIIQSIQSEKKENRKVVLNASSTVYQASKQACLFC